MTVSGIAALEIAIVTAIDTAWNDRLPTHWPNAAFAVPNDTAWLDVDVLWGDADPFTLGLAGAGKNLGAGLVQFTMNGLRGQGRGALMGHVDVVRDILNRKTIGSLRFGAASAPMPGNPNDAWESVIVRVPFTFEETF